MNKKLLLLGALPLAGSLLWGPNAIADECADGSDYTPAGSEGDRVEDVDQATPVGTVYLYDPGFPTSDEGGYAGVTNGTGYIEAGGHADNGTIVSASDGTEDLSVTQAGPCVSQAQ